MINAKGTGLVAGDISIVISSTSYVSKREVQVYAVEEGNADLHELINI